MNRKRKSIVALLLSFSFTFSVVGCTAPMHSQMEELGYTDAELETLATNDDAIIQQDSFVFDDLIGFHGHHIPSVMGQYCFYHHTVSLTC